MTPEWITDNKFNEAVIATRKSRDTVALDKGRVDCFCEGFSVKIMHMGSYDDEGPVLAKIHDELMPVNGFVENGKHREIYLSDPRRVMPEKLKTVLRQPVQQK